MIFVDTSFWLALRNKSDPLHEEALCLLTDHGQASMLTTTQVCGEVYEHLHRRAGYLSQIHFAQHLDVVGRVRVAPLSQVLQRDALTWMLSRPERPYSFVEASSALVMRAFRIRDVLTFNDAYVDAGFHPLRD